MNNLTLTLTLKDDTIFSEHAATEGGHRSLPYIPGSALLGSAAAHLYSKVSLQESWLLFHSGKVRFLNAYPCINPKQPTQPAALCWHTAKDTLTEHKDIIYVGTQALGNHQPKQVRSGFFTDDMHVIDIQLDSRMKTAIDPDKGRAADAQLFDYQFIPAGHRFVGNIQIDPDTPPKLIDMIMSHFSSGTLLLGKSRSAEYGQVEVHIEANHHSRAPTNTASTLTLWLTSDMALTDPTGTALVNPTCLSQLHPSLPKAAVRKQDTYKQTRSYTVWNAFKRGYDIQRQVIRSGSLLSFDLPEKALQDEHLVILQQGVGLYRENGLGQVCINHPNTQPGAKLQKKTYQPPASANSLPMTQTPLMGWLRQQLQAKSSLDEVKSHATNAVKEYRKLLQNHRNLFGLDQTIHVGPSASQWGSVLEAAKTAAKDEDLKTILFGGNSPIITAKKPGWEDTYLEQGQEKTFYDWIKNTCNQYQGNDLRSFIAHLADQAKNSSKPTGGKPA